MKEKIIKIKDFIEKNKINFIFFIYVILSFIIMLFHESWRDEAQSWLIGRDLSFVDILKQMKYEGHPVIWYWIVAIFAKLGFPYITIKFISLIITDFSIYMILKKSPFDNTIKILISFSSIFLYYYPAIPRSYCLIPLAISLISIIYEKRDEKCIEYILAIIFLANTHIIMLGLVGMLLFFFFLEQFKNRKMQTKAHNKKIILSFVLTILLLFLTALPIISSLKVNTDVNNKFDFEMIKNFPEQIKIIFNFIFGKEYDVVLYATIIILMIYEVKYYPKSLVIIVLTITYQLLIYTFIYNNSYQRAGCAILIIICVCWIQKTKKSIKEAEKIFVELLVIYLLIINIVNGYDLIKLEICNNYSNAKQTSEFIKENLQDGIFICPNMAYASAIIPYLDKNTLFWNPEAEEYFTFVTWDENYIQKYSFDELKKKIINNFSSNDKLYFINPNYNEEFFCNNEIELIYRAENSIRGENFEIYSINGIFK